MSVIEVHHTVATINFLAFLADRRAYATVLRPYVCLYRMYCG